jgi:hypothetical protein
LESTLLGEYPSGRKSWTPDLIHKVTKTGSQPLHDQFKSRNGGTGSSHFPWYISWGQRSRLLMCRSIHVT